MRPSRPARAWLVACLGLAAAPAAAQQLTLAEALRRADGGAYANRIAAGQHADRAGQRQTALRGILPTLRAEGGFVRTTEPLGAFAATLRQREVSLASFDPARLNYPPPTGNWGAALVAEVPLVNFDAWAGRRAADHGAAAGAAAGEWTRLGTRTDVIRAYYGAVLATERVATLTAAATAAHGHVRQAEAMVREGLVTRSDALLAAVRAGEVDAQLAEAHADAQDARRQLAVLLGAPAETAFVLPASLPAADRIRALTASDTAAAVLAARADVDAAERGLAAAQADAFRAKSAYLPRVNSFARLDWNSPSGLYAGDDSWTVGLMLSWTPFAGGSEIGDIRSAGGREAAARAMAEAAAARAELELAQTRAAVQVALARLDIAERGVAQSREAHRIVTRKYEGGLAGVVELLDAAATETASALGFAHARFATIAAAAARRRATGGDPGTLATLDAPGPGIDP
ncbi:MAG TPA: TolC family protein [Gemmatimonadales bacterium]|nr:TolC family protein [Gemmatimonadales bacterium]